MIFVATAGFDRFDFLAGSGPFAITPAVILSPLLLASLAVDWLNGHFRRPAIEREFPLFRSSLPWLILALYLTASISSLVVNGTPDQPTRRLALLVIIAVGAWLAVIRLRSRDTRQALQAACWIGLCLGVAVSAAETVQWILVGPAIPTRVGPVDITSPTYGLFAPRPSGMSLDPNRGAFVAAFLFYIAAVGPAKREANAGKIIVLVLLSGLVVLPSFSRTGIVVWLVLLCAVIARSGVRQRVSSVMALLALAASAVGLVVWLAGRNSSLDLGQLIAERGQFASDTSGGIHFELFSVALDTVSTSASRLLLGVGFGNSADYLTDIFGSNSTTGNFHSIYLSGLVEGGIVGLILLLSLLLPTLGMGRFSLSVSVIGFNFFYQANLDASFWVCLGFLWLSPSPRLMERDQSPPLAHLGQETLSAEPVVNTATFRTTH